MKKPAYLVFLVLFGTAQLLRADEQTRAVQEQLKDLGFYYGQVDGESGAETSAAIRRYQIRNGFQVTGTLTQETLNSLNAGNKGANPQTPGSEPPPRSVAPPVNPPPVQSPQGNVNQADQQFLREQAPPSNSQPVQPPVRDPNVIAPPVNMAQQPAMISVQFATLFRRTPYENAPIEVQQQTLKNAQLRLVRHGFYDGIIDGLPGPATSRAISVFQDSAGLRPTGRLDMDTLAELRLLPGGGRPVVAQPFYPPPPYGAPGVYRGIWVR